MFFVPNHRATITQDYAYFQAQIGDGLTALRIEELAAQIQNSADISNEEETALLTALKAVTIPEAATTADNEITAYQKDFAAWYMSNLVVISVVQWLFIFFLVIKNSK